MTNQYRAKCVVCGKTIEPGEGVQCGSKANRAMTLIWEHKVFCIKGPRPAEPADENGEVPAAKKWCAICGGNMTMNEAGYLECRGRCGKQIDPSGYHHPGCASLKAPDFGACTCGMDAERASEKGEVKR